jgi:demethylmenaquinone methyltransferase/2-methoxy-6-polyprenyl-1,4-benzoquinol methylase
VTAELHPAVAVGGEERQRRIREMFAGIAPRYELVNHVASGFLDVAWRRAAVRELRLRPGDWCVDACCGTGDLSRAVAGAGARVIGADFCRPMLAQGQAGCREAGVAALVEADARSLPLRNASMDGACVAFGIRNVVPPEAGLAELARVVRPGGRVVILEFSEPRHPVARALCRFYVGTVLPFACDLLSGRRGTYKYLSQTIGRWMAPAELGAAMERAGIGEVTWRPLTFGAVMLHAGTVTRHPEGNADAGPQDLP